MQRDYQIIQSDYRVILQCRDASLIIPANILPELQGRAISKLHFHLYRLLVSWGFCKNDDHIGVHVRRSSFVLCKAYKDHAYHSVMQMNLSIQDLYSRSGKTSYRQISRSLEDARLDGMMIVTLWNLTGISATLLSRCLSYFRAIAKV